MNFEIAYLLVISLPKKRRSFHLFLCKYSYKPQAARLSIPIGSGIPRFVTPSSSERSVVEFVQCDSGMCEVRGEGSEFVMS